MPQTVPQIPMDLELLLSERNSIKLVAMLKDLLLQTLSDPPKSVLPTYQCNLLLEKLLEQIRNFMCGNFCMEPATELFDDFQLERELVEQDVLGFFIVNLGRLSVRVSRHLVEVFSHVLANYAYETRRPMVEALQNNEYLLSQLYRFVCHRSDTVSSVSSQLLVACCSHYSLARKLVDLPASGDSNTVGTSFYIQLLQSVPDCGNLNQLACIFRVVRALLLTKVELALYAFTRDLHQLIKALNLILQGDKCHHYARFKCLLLFADLIQNRKLEPLLSTYTTSLANLQLFFSWALKTHNSLQCRHEFIKIFEILRLFFLNPNKRENEDFKKFCIDNYMMLTKIVDYAQHVRSYSDLALMYPEYDDVRRSIDQMADKQVEKDSSRRVNRFSSSDSI